jgi:L-fuculose-phosphate aldolase
MEILKQQLVDIGKKLYKKGLSPGFSGNLSVRYGKYFLVTPSGYPLGEFKKEDVVLIDKDFKIIDGTKKPSSEAKMHLEIYAIRPDFEAIIHCHAPKASAFAVAGVPLSQPVLAESIFHLGNIPIAKYHLPSTINVAKETAKHFDNNDVVLMQNHGVVLGAKSLYEAYYKMETVEYTAEVILNAKILGGGKELAPEQVQDIINLRMQLGK